MDNDKRKTMGRRRKGIEVPVAPLSSTMDESYFQMKEIIVSKIKETRTRFVFQANVAMIELYWNIGKEILERQEREGWGTSVIDRLSADLKEIFPEMNGFSTRNLSNMKRFASTWRENSILQQPVAKLQWRSIIKIMDKVKDEKAREWYAQKSLTNGWSSNVLHFMIEGQLYEREGKAITNFELSLPPLDSDMAIQTFKDPYLFDFIGTAAKRRETEIEKSLVEHMEKFLLELGQGFSFVGRQFHVEVGGDDFYLDLLFYHLKLRCFVVIELKAREFDPGDVSKLSMYQNIVNEVLKHPDDKPTIGLLLVKGKNKTVVEYSLEGYRNPISVADWQEQLVTDLPEELKSSLPSIDEIEKEIEFATAVAKMEDAGTDG